MSSKMIVFMVILLCIISGIVVLERNNIESQNIDLSGITVIDGDTFKTADGESIRLLGINTEEREMPHAVDATQKLEELLSHGEIVLEMDAAFSSPVRVTFTGSTIPAFISWVNSPVSALRP